ncbi:hypothetical protein CG015_18455 [Vibrio anguillarum]|nr:hypothetical protein CG015_18455 [Vibrio anguillarum]
MVLVIKVLCGKLVVALAAP